MIKLPSSWSFSIQFNNNLVILHWKLYVAVTITIYASSKPIIEAYSYGQEGRLSCVGQDPSVVQFFISRSVPLLPN